MKLFLTTIRRIYPITFIIILFGCEQEINISPLTKPIPIAKIIISSNPPGAKIYEDGRNSSLVTPDTLSWLEEKEYNFTLKLKNYRDSSFTINVKKDQVLDLKIDFTTNPNMRGNISFLTNNKGADIYLNDSLLNFETPKIISGLLPGEYKVKYVLENHRTDSTYVTVRSKEVITAYVNLIDTTNWVDYIERNSEIESNYLKHISIDKYDNKWISSSSLGLIILDSKEKFHSINTSNSILPSEVCRRVYFGEDNTTWVANYRGLVSISNNVISYQQDGDGRYALPSANIYDLAFDKDNRLWAATDTGVAVSEYPNYKTWEVYLDEITLPDGSTDRVASNYVAITVDEYNNVFAGNKNGEILIFNEGSWFYLPNTPKSPYSQITEMEARNGHLYIAMETKKIKGLPIIYGKLMRYSYTNSHGLSGYWDDNYKRLSSNEIYSVLTEENGDLWVATNRGLHYYKSAGNHVHYTQNNSTFYSNDVADLDVDSNGDIWVVLRNAGLHKFKRNLLLGK